ncbi:MAG: HAD family hydrolase [Lachnospiraceae bacterium]|nr:HAD family hydrolase [Lachnospiraceae bacterium]
MGYSTVIFDLDGTLLDTLDDLTDSVNFAMRTMGWKERSKKDVRSFLGNGIRVLMKKSSPDNATEEEFEIAFKAFKEYYDIHNQDKTVPYDGMIELMKRLKLKGIKMAIVSNKVQEAVDVLKDKFFSDVLEYALGDTPGMARKPEPDSCYKALELLGSSKEDTVYVGDSEVDLETAKNAGLDCIAVLWGFRDEDYLVEQGAKVFAKNPEDIERLVIG